MSLKNNIVGLQKESWFRSIFLIIYLGGLVFLFVITFVFGWQPLQLNNPNLLVPAVIHNTGGSDYHYFYYAGLRARLHENFYFVVKDRFDGELGDLAQYIRFIYPPLMAYFFIPFSLFSFYVSLFIFSLLTILLFIWSIFILSKFVREKWWYFVIATVIFIFSPFFFLHLDHGQTNIPIIFLISLCFLFYLKQKYKIAGLLLAASIMFKLMPIIFLPYFFIKNKKVFYSTLVFLFLFCLFFGFDTMMDFMAAILSFGSDSINAGGWNVGLGGLFYNRFTYHLLTLSQAQPILSVLSVVIVAVFYYLFYKANKAVKKLNGDNSLVLLEFGTLMFLVSFLPSVSCLHNGLYYLFIFTFYWNFRPNLPVIFDFLIQALFYLSISQPLLFPILGEQPFMTIFAFRPLNMLIIVILLWYFYFRANKRNKKEVIISAISAPELLVNKSSSVN